MFSKPQILEIVCEQLAIECNCRAGDFGKAENVITTPALSDKRRKFSDQPFFFKMTTMGGNAVISADECLHDWIAEFAQGKPGHELFEHTNLREIDRQLAPHGKQLFQTHHMFLPFKDNAPQMMDIPIKWFEQDELHQFYEGTPFPNAFCETPLPERPDMLGVAAMEGESIVAMAGCSADTPLMWQVGVDVIPTHRGRGLAAQLVSRLRDEILARGKIPYYGTSLSNIYSWKTALTCGFCPSWIDTENM